MASSLSSYLPPGDGFLPKWLLFIAVVSIGNSVQCYISTAGSREVYAGQPPVKAMKESSKGTHLSPVNELSARTFGTWTALSSIIRLYAAYNIHDPLIYQLALWSYVIAFAHFFSEWLVFGSARWNRGFASPVFDLTAIDAKSPEISIFLSGVEVDIARPLLGLIKWNLGLTFSGLTYELHPRQR